MKRLIMPTLLVAIIGISGQPAFSHGHHHHYLLGSPYSYGAMPRYVNPYGSGMGGLGRFMGMGSYGTMLPSYTGRGGNGLFHGSMRRF